MKVTAEETIPPGELYCATCEKTFHEGDHCPSDGARLVKLKAVVDPLIGRELDGRYTVIEKLGQGGMGAVYRARQHSIDREVAIKVVNANLVTNQDVIKRFLREAKLASKLSHPHAVAVLDFGQSDDGTFYLVMELVSGHTLDVVFREQRTFPPERVVRIGTQICDALAGAHALSIVHRDLKPSNIMMLDGTRDFVKVLDFGLAKSTSPDQTSTTMTGTGGIVGTPSYMPPELATGRPCDARSDIYSLGCILYLLGSGQLPYSASSVHELVAMHGSTAPVPPVTGVPKPLAAVIDKMLRKDPAERYQSAEAARTALENALAALGPRASQPSVAPGSSAFAEAPTLAGETAAPRARRRWIAVAAVLAIAGAATAAVVVTRSSSPDPAVVPAVIGVDAAAPVAVPAPDAAVEQASLPPDAAAPEPPVAVPPAAGSSTPKRPRNTTTVRPRDPKRSGSSKPPVGSDEEVPF